jgi:sulfur-oxidizing protein SoxX
MVRQYHQRNVRLTIIVAAILFGAAGIARGGAAPEMPTPLTNQPGDPANGLKLALDFDKGDCVICHKMPIPGQPPDAFGDIGPDLTGIGARLSMPQLRQRIVDPKAVDPNTLMPAFHTTQGLTRVDPKFAGKPILSAQEVEDLVAYLATLK